jgi:hypothetical protein
MKEINVYFKSTRPLFGEAEERHDGRLSGSGVAWNERCSSQVSPTESVYSTINGSYINRMQRCGLDSSGSGHRQVEGSCEHGKEASGCEFLLASQEVSRCPELVTRSGPSTPHLPNHGARLQTVPH